jgi:5-methylcytosine-specific restriction enzyme subunit McrC
MQRLGVSARTPTRSEVSVDRLSRHDAADRRMLDAAHLVHDMAIPAHQAGGRVLPKLLDDDQKYRLLFEKAVRGFFTHSPDADAWTVGHPHLHWHDGRQSGTTLLPRMETDTVLTDVGRGRRIVIETKFADALTENHFQGSATTIKRDYLYQLYAYLMSQTGTGNDLDDRAEGVLLFVAANGRAAIDESVEIQGHRIRFLSVDLSETPELIRRRWLRCIAPNESATG